MEDTYVKAWLVVSFVAGCLVAWLSPAVFEWIRSWLPRRRSTALLKIAEANQALLAQLLSEIKMLQERDLNHQRPRNQRKSKTLTNGLGSNN